MMKRSFSFAITCICLFLLSCGSQTTTGSSRIRNNPARTIRTGGGRFALFGSSKTLPKSVTDTRANS